MSELDDKGRTRRKHRRVPAREVTAEIRTRGGVSSYTVLNISTGGVMISGGRVPPRGTFEIELQQEGRPALSLPGHVVHELAQGIGISFDPMTSEVAEAVARLVAAVEVRNGLPPPLPPGRALREDVLPPPGERSTHDPFATGPDPRPPRSSSPDERAEYLRTLVKKRDEALQRGRTAYAAAIAEADGLRAAATAIKSRLEAALTQVALGEAALTSSRRAAEKAAEALLVERETHQEMLDNESRRTLEAIGTVAGLEAKLRRTQTDLASAREQAEAARRETSEVLSDSAALRRSREELSAANKKAMEAQVALNRERATRQAGEAPLVEARAALQTADAENKKLVAELARLKAKLIAAESALERSATKRAPPR